jgi:hypothetical protein
MPDLEELIKQTRVIEVKSLPRVMEELNTSKELVAGF